MKGMLKSTISKKRMVILALLTIHCSLFISPVRAQVGTWRNYLSYYEPQQIVKAGNVLFVRASNDLYQYNLTDHSITTYDKLTGLSDNYITHIAWNQQAKRLIIVYQNSNIDLMDTAGNITNISSLYRKATTEDKTIDSLTIDAQYAYLYARLGIVKVDMKRAEIKETYTKNHPDYPTSLPPYVNNDWSQYIDVVKTLKPGGPKYNFFQESVFKDGKLYATGGYFLSGTAEFNRPGTVQVWDGNDWTVFQDELAAITGYEYVDNNCIDIDPTDASHVAVGGRCGLYEFKDGQLLKYHNQQNSPIRGAMSENTELPDNYNLINGVKFDINGHLWVLNSQAKGSNLLKLTNDGQWKNMTQSLLNEKDGVSMPGLKQMFIDSRGLLWFVNSHWTTPALFCYNINTNKLIRYNNFTNQDGTQNSIGTVNCVCEDLEGNIWTGTNQGPFMIQKSEAGQENITFQQIKVPRNDGSNFADYLLSGVNINFIAIDGGGRKWFGTNGAGAFLVSADNMTQLQYFNADNSKLLSNTVMSIALNQQTGEVFFLTDKGLCSYISDATTTAKEMTKDNVYAYPNPVTPDYTGLITVVGLTLNADVKILSSNGKLMAEGRSNGGTFTWNGCDRDGNRVASGVYMVVTATDDGKKGTVCKIAVIR